jgi:phage tail tape-measure protein
VTANTAVAISASMGGISQTSSIIVLAPLDTVKVTKAEFTVRNFQLKVEATSTSTASTMTVWNAANGALIGTLANAGGGKYTGAFTRPSVLSITVKSSLGGSATGAVLQK